MMKSYTFEDHIPQTSDERESGGKTGFRRNKSIPQPKQHVITMLLNYSRALSVKETKAMGTVSFLVN